MEKDHKVNFVVPVLLTELFGTMLFGLAANLSPVDSFAQPLAFFALIVCCYDVSGGHLNPSITLGVYVTERDYKKHVVYLIILSLAQLGGALMALSLGYLLRVTVTIEGTEEQFLEPNVYPKTPPIILSTDGMPGYGQIMLSETIGTFILVLTSVSARTYIKFGPAFTVAQAALVMAAGLAAVQHMFREISGGVCNPAIALANIVWQEFTLKVDQDNQNSQWTYEYALSFFIGPLMGAFLAGVCQNMLTHTAYKMREENFGKDMVDDSVPDPSVSALSRSFQHDNNSQFQGSPRGQYINKMYNMEVF